MPRLAPIRQNLHTIYLIISSLLFLAALFYFLVYQLLMIRADSIYTKLAL